MIRGENIYYKIRKKEYTTSCYRNNRKIIRTLVCKKNARFVKVWEKQSNQNIACEGNNLYFENHRKCFTLCGFGRRPVLRYKLPPCPTSQKIEDALICKYPLEEIPWEHKGYRPSFIAVTAHNWLFRYDIDSGCLLQKVYLSTKYKFRHVTWDSEHRIVVRSTHCKQPSGQAGSRLSNLLMAIAVFTVFPLQFVGMMEVTRKVFGRDITDAHLSQGVLIVMSQGGVIRLYSFDHILSQGQMFAAKLGVYCEHFQGRVGMPPDGLPLNIQLSDCPAVLFQIRCADHYLHLGGIPWHYIISPPGTHGTFQVYTLETGSQVRHGCLDTASLSVESDKALFHSDDSGRILHIAANTVRILKLVRDIKDEDCISLKEVYRIDASTPTPPETVAYTSSGRRVRRNTVYQQAMDTTHEHIIRATDYEVDLDLLTITCVYEQHDGGCHGSFMLYDNQTGVKVQEISLADKWKEFCEHDIIMDLDTIVHISKSPNRQFTCSVYVLDRKLDE